MKKKIVYITGTRAEYGLIKNVLNAINKTDKFEVCLIVTGMHLSEEFGKTVKEIEKDGLKIYSRLDLINKEDTTKSMVKYIGELTSALAEEIGKIDPALIIVVGDRGEALAASIAGAYMNIPIAHLHGGEVSGTIDESVRHAITKLAHIHFVSSEKSKERLIKMGEEPKRIFVVGAPGLDNILNLKIDKDKIIERLCINQNEPLIVVLQHPVTTEFEYSEKQIKETMDSIRELKLQTIIIYPNSDAGGRKMIKVIESYNLPFVKRYKSMPVEDYLSLLSVASVLVGNSSSGIIESAFLKIPVVNIGTRQNGRDRSGNIIDVDYKKSDITDAIKKSIYDKSFLDRVKKCKSVYGDGKTGEKIVKILSNFEFDRDIVQKRLTY